MKLKFLLGIVLGVTTFFGLFFSFIAFVGVVSLAKRSHSSIYIIAASNLFIDCIQMLLALGYLVPSIILEDWLFEGGRENKFVVFLGAVFLFCWYNGSVAQILMAVNRLVVVCFPSSPIFTRRLVLITVLALYPAAVIFSWLSQYVSPCCQFSFDHNYLSYTYTPKGTTPNYSNMYLDLPLNSTSSGICAISYFVIILYVRRHSGGAGLTDAVRQKRRMKEYVYALQFCAISIFYLIAWVFFRVFPIIIGSGSENWFSIVSICVTINSSANAAVYLISNKEVRQVVLARFLGHFSKYRLSSIVNARTSSHQHSAAHTAQTGVTNNPT